MSRTIKHWNDHKKGKMPKLEKGTKTTLRKRLLKELEDDAQ